MLRQFFKDSAIYGGANILVRGISLLLVPLYTRALAPADYGIVDILTVLASFVTVTVALEIAQGVARYFPDTDDEHERIGFASTSLWFSVAAYSAFLAITLLLADPLSAWLLESAGAVPVLRVSLLSIWLTGLFYLVQSQLRYSLRPREYALASLVFSFGSLATSALFVLILRQGVIGVFYGQALGAAVGLAVALFFSRGVYRLRFDGTKLGELLRFSLPLVPSSVGVIVTMYVDRIAIKQLMTLSDVGLFGIGYRVASVTSLLMVGFTAALTPLVYAHYREPGTPFELARIFRYFTATALLVCLGLAVFARDILRVVAPPEYIQGASVVPMLAPALLLSGMYIFAPGLGIAKRTMIISGLNIGGAVMNTTLNFALVPHFGIQGAALATLLSNAAAFGANMVAGQRLYNVPHRWERLGLAVLGSLAVFVASELQPLIGWAGIGLRLGLLGMAAIWYVWLGLVEPQDVRRAVARVRRVNTGT